MNNRAARRAAARGKIPGGVKYYRVPLTPPEMELVAEGLDALRRTMDEDLEGMERTPRQEWAYDRAGRIRDILQAELEGRPYHDTVANRLEPEGP